MSNLSPALVRRLPEYFRTLIKFYGEGKERISSEELAQELGLVPSQVRTDIKALGCTGQRSYGYGIPALYKKIADILQLSDKFSAVIVGTSPIVQALSESEIFAKRGIKLTAVFEEAHGGWAQSGRYTIKRLAELEEHLKQTHTDIIILGGDTAACEQTIMIAELMQSKPVIWNFTNSALTSRTLKVSNIHLCDLLMLLCYEIGKEEEGK